MKIYTKTGDQGETALLGGRRVWKDDLRIDAYGTIDELNASLGLVRCEAIDDPLSGLLQGIQSDLFDIGAELASPDPQKGGVAFDRPDRVSVLETAIDDHDSALAELKNFILPAGTRTACLLHLSRTVCRRGERCVILLHRERPGSVSPTTIEYLNRLSDLLFVLARFANHSAGVEDTPWTRRGNEPES